MSTPNLKTKYGIKGVAFVDAATGEVMADEQTYRYSLKDEDSYVKLYTDNIRYLMNLPKSNLNVLLLIFEVADYSNRGGYILLPAGRKKQFCKVLGIGMSSLNSVISELVKTKLLIRESTGLYKMNPWLFGKGGWADIVTERENNKQFYADIHGKNFADYKKGGIGL